MNKLILVGIFAGAAASIPVLYQSNPQAFESLLNARLTLRPEPTAPPASQDDPLPPRLASAEPEEPVLLGRKVRLPADKRGHFAADFRLNGQSEAAMIDTGATLVAINTSTARRIGIVLTPSDFHYKVSTANGQTKAAAATIDQIQIGK